MNRKGFYLFIQLLSVCLSVKKLLSQTDMQIYAHRCVCISGFNGVVRALKIITARLGEVLIANFLRVELQSVILFCHLP